MLGRLKSIQYIALQTLGLFTITDKTAMSVSLSTSRVADHTASNKHENHPVETLASVSYRSILLTSFFDEARLVMCNWNEFVSVFPRDVCKKMKCPAIKNVLVGSTTCHRLVGVKPR